MPVTDPVLFDIVGQPITVGSECFAPVADIAFLPLRVSGADVIRNKVSLYNPEFVVHDPEYFWTFNSSDIYIANHKLAKYNLAHNDLFGCNLNMGDYVLVSESDYKIGVGQITNTEYPFRIKCLTTGTIKYKTSKGVIKIESQQALVLKLSNKGI